MEEINITQPIVRCDNWLDGDELVVIEKFSIDYSLFDSSNTIIKYHLLKGMKYIIQKVNENSFVLGNDKTLFKIEVDKNKIENFRNITLGKRVKEARPPKEKVNKVKDLIITVTQGLSGCGKSTWANEQVVKAKGSVINITKDDIRSMLYGYNKNEDINITKGQENFVLTVRDSIVKDALNSGINVIISDTNLHPKHEVRMKEIAEEINKNNTSFNVSVKVKSFLDVPIETCIKRDLKRTHSVGEAVIRRQLKDYENWNSISDNKYSNEKKFIPLVQNKNLQKGIIVDLDGTTALFKDIYCGNDVDGKPMFKTTRDPYNAKDCHITDMPNPFVIELVKMYKNTGHTVLFVSGRKDIYKDETIKFLQNQFDWCQVGNPEFHLYMRGNDTRPDNIVKKEIFDENIRNKYYITTVIDDRDKVVAMWRYDIGLNVLQVADGAF